MRIIDSHMHFIDVDAHDWYPALKGWGEAVGKPELYRTFDLADHRTSARAADLAVDAYVHVSATTKPRAYLDEARWVSDLADAHDLDLVLVGTVDPELPSTQIEADLNSQAEDARFRGVRVLYGLEPGSRAADVVLSWLRERDLVFDLVINPGAMAGWLDQLSAHPGLRVVLEHTGWPDAVDTEGRRAWDEAMSRFAAETEAGCKLSGLGMAMMDLSADVIGPWLERSIELLGWDRVMFGSNMPIETMGGSYTDLVSTLRSVTAGTDEESLTKFWGANAAAAYRL